MELELELDLNGMLIVKKVGEVFEILADDLSLTAGIRILHHSFYIARMELHRRDRSGAGSREKERARMPRTIVRVNTLHFRPSTHEARPKYEKLISFLFCIV